MLKSINKNTRALLFIITVLAISSCGINDPGDKDLLESEVEISAQTAEAADSFTTTGYIKSLDSSKKSDSTFYATINLEILSGASYGDVEMTMTVEGVETDFLLKDYAFAYASYDENQAPVTRIGAWITFELPELNGSHMQNNFSLKFSKNVLYKIKIGEISSTISSQNHPKDVVGCNEKDVYSTSETKYVVIDQTIESI